MILEQMYFSWMVITKNMFIDSCTDYTTWHISFIVWQIRNNKFQHNCKEVLLAFTDNLSLQSNSLIYSILPGRLATVFLSCNIIPWFIIQTSRVMKNSWLLLQNSFLICSYSQFTVMNLKIHLHHAVVIDTWFEVNDAYVNYSKLKCF